MVVITPPTLKWQVVNKMTLEQWFRNNRGIGIGGADLPQAMLEELCHDRYTTVTRPLHDRYTTIVTWLLLDCYTLVTGDAGGALPRHREG